MSSAATENPMLCEEPISTTTAETIPEQVQAPNQVGAGTQPPMVPFKERVIGVAKKTRGTLLGKPELKEHGEKILQGEASIHNINEPPSL
ncbi:hypothetical protein K438DRAFT_765052 [Mycena galopus ATCC 62051]|nr:hypothetical protein K438DRAFT_765052 [Mycena galopus ATCC 62051]